MADVLLSIDAAGVALVTLNRPEANNTWTPELERAFYKVLNDIDRDPAVRVAVLTGAGRMFCPGVGGDRLDELAGSGGLDYSQRIPFTRTLEFRKPLIGAINGGCAGVGFIQAMFCDIRFMSARAKITTAFARRGLPAEHAISWLLPRIIGLERSLDLLLSARTLNAEEALRIGLVSRVVEPEDLLRSATAYARDIADNCAPLAVAAIKQQVRVDLDATYVEALERAYLLTVEASNGVEFREAIDAYIGNRPPRFTGTHS